MKDLKIFTENIEEEAVAQINLLMDLEPFENSKVRIMPDVHAGAGCVIGFTGDLGDKVIPNIVGVDIGCGMLTVELNNIDINLEELDIVIRKYVPSGINTHEGRIVRFPSLTDLICYRGLKDSKRIERSIGSLGGGNHFIEIDIDEANNKYLIIHSGSRNLGKQVANIYQDLAIDLCSGKGDYFEKRDSLIKEYKEEGKRNEIQSALKDLEKLYENLSPSLPRDLCFLEDKYRDNYLHDMEISQNYATLNRETMANIILDKLLGKSISDFNYFHTVHNYIDINSNIVRKGAISAKKGEKVLIPINMKDGCILATGKGNKDWNESAPHGAGRIMSRTKAKETLNLEEFKDSMKGIYTTSVNEYTLDEAPSVYKPIEEIINNIKDTVIIDKIIKPIYNFKASK